MTTPRTSPVGAAIVADRGAVPVPVGDASPSVAIRRRPEPWADRAWSTAVALRYPLGVFVASRLVLGMALVASGWLAPSLRLRSVLGASWDAGWYLQIAQHGYPHGIVFSQGGARWAFFPAYPAAVRAISALTTLSLVDASTLVAFLFGLTAVVGVWLAVRQLAGQEVAERTVLLFAFFPTAYVLGMGYAEGLFVTCAALCLYALGRRAWWWAAALATVGSLTRSMGFVLVAVVLVSLARQWWAERRGSLLLPALVAPAGMVAWLAYSWAQARTPFAFIHAEREWGSAHFAFFRAPFVSAAHVLGSAHGFRVAADVMGTLTLLYSAVGVTMLVLARVEGKRLPVEWWVMGLGGILVAFTSYWSSSTLRFAWVVFPFQAALACRLSGRWTSVLSSSFAMAQGVLAVVVFVGLVHWQHAPLSP